MTTHNDHERDDTAGTPPLTPDTGSGEHEQLVVAEPSSVEPGTLEPVVLDVPPAASWPAPAEQGRDGHRPVEGTRTAPAETAPPVNNNPYVVRTTVPPMNPMTTGAPLAEQPAPVAAPSPGAPFAAPAGPGIPGGEIYSAAPGGVYVAPPRAPRKKGNRLIGSLIALLGTLVFAVVYAAAAAVIFAVNAAIADRASTLVRFLLNPAFIVPVVFFAIALILVVVVVNRAGWWAYVLGGFLVALVVYAGAVVGAYLSIGGWNLSPTDQTSFVRSLVMDPLPLSAAIVAREASVWTGAWIAARGRRVTARNAAARAEFERARAEPPAASPVW